MFHLRGRGRVGMGGFLVPVSRYPIHFLRYTIKFAEKQGCRRRALNLISAIARQQVEVAWMTLFAFSRLLDRSLL